MWRVFYWRRNLAFQYRDPGPVYFNNDGTVCAGGSLTYSRTGTSTALAVYTDSGLGTSLGNVITLDASGRAQDHWLDASTYAYRVVLKNSAGTTQYTRDNVREIDTAAVDVPDPGDGDDGDVLFTDGVDFYFEAIRQVPDPTGHSGKVLGTDGAALAWQTLASESYDEDDLPGGIEEDDDASGSVCIGHVRIQWGTDTAPTAAAITSTKAVTFHTAFSGTPWFVVVSPAATGVTNNSPADYASGSYSSPSSTGFTAALFCGAENNAGTIAITSTIPFTWLAIGPK